jgi:hypothetical protein
MKIEVTGTSHGLITSTQGRIQRGLLWHLYESVYPGHKERMGNRLDLLREVDLAHMARVLRAQGWCAYYWRDRHGLDNVEDHNTHINYGRREGIIIGRYCANLTAWLLSHT